MGKKHQSTQVEVIVSFGGPAPGTNPKYPPRHVNVDPQWEPYYTSQGGIDVAHFSGQTAQEQFDCLRGNKYIQGAIQQGANYTPVNQWLQWADTNGGYTGTLPDTQKCPTNPGSPQYNPAPK